MASSNNLPQTLQGTTEPFKGNGRKFGYPTANFYSDTGLTDGVYFGYASLSGYIDQPALIFIGTPTTVGDTERRVEAWLLDIIDKDYYHLPISVDLRQYHRGNQTFESVDVLLDIMRQDEAAARQWFSAGDQSRTA